MTSPVDTEATTGTRAKPERVIRVVGAEDRDPRPEILLSPNVHETTTAMVDALRADDALYQRAGELVHVVRHEDEDDARHAIGTPLVQSVPLSWLTDRVSMHAMCLTRSKKGDAKHVPPPLPRVRAVHEARMWRGIRHLEGVSEAPQMRPDGSIHQEPGYDKATRTLYVPGATFPTVADAPTHSDAVIAYARIADVFCDFPYAAPEHRSATIAALLTLLARNAIKGAVPCWVFDASSKRSGKSLQSDVISLIATGRMMSRMTFLDDEKELESVLGSYALAGARVVPFDNINCKFGGAALDKVITATGDVDLRILGRSELRTLPWRAVVFGSGNNVEFRDDMLPRVLSPRLEPPMENPETRTGMKHGNADALRAYALEHRAELVHAALTVLRAYAAAGRPAVPVSLWGGFDDWVRVVASALVWIGAPDPLGARRGLNGDEDGTRVAEGALVAGWRKLCLDHGPDGLTVSAALAELYPAPKHDEAPDGCDGIREALEELVHTRPGFTPPSDRVSRALAKLKGRPIDGHRLVIAGKTHGIRRWRVDVTRTA